MALSSATLWEKKLLPVRSEKREASVAHKHRLKTSMQKISRWDGMHFRQKISNHGMHFRHL